jgi:SAM-dependent methyltransferase
MSTNLDTIAKNFGTDKSSEIHNYCDKYSRYIPFNRYDNLNILEIGVLDGKSLLTWRDYFYRSKVIGIDIEPTSKQYENLSNQIYIEVGSQADDIFLNDVIREHGPFDMILDDGSHMNSHVIFSFEHLFQSVKSGGLYIVEDCATSYWEHWEGGFRKETTMIEYFKRLVDDINFRGVMNLDKSNVHARREDWCTETVSREQPDCRTDIESITFLNGIIMIRKR